MKKYIFYGFLFLFVFNSCDQTEPNDPCENATPFKAEIEIYETIDDTLILTDTVLAGHSILFKSKKQYSSFEWTIGEAQRTFNDNHVSLFFRKDQVGNNIRVRLIARGTPNLQCIPNDDGIDTVYRNIYIAEKWKPAFLGDFKGCILDEPIDTFIVNIYDYQYYESGDYNRGIVLNNINKGCKEPIPNGPPLKRVRHGYKYFTFDSGSTVGYGCLAVKGFAFLSDDNNEITIIYNSLDNPVQRIFHGRRL